ncbi:MAG TPA: Uma2 family endonuclease [Chryseosolibacter sp.]
MKDSTGRKMNDEEFERFCLANPDLRIERNSNLEILIMSPNTPLSGQHGAEILRQLLNWNFENNKGVVFDASAGFTLPDRSILSPDASWMSHERWASVSPDEREKFSRVCPEFVIEVRSDSFKDLKSKMESWVRNGAKLGWLIDPKRNTHWIYRPGADPVEINNELIPGEGSVEGFILDMKLFRD